MISVHDTPERTLLRDQVARFIAHDVEPHGDAWERDGCVPRDVLRRMGADIELEVTGESCGEPFGELRIRASALQGTTIAGEEIPNVIDEIPALAIAAAFADGVTDIRDAAELLVSARHA